MTTDFTHQPPPSTDVLDRYLAGEATQAERAVVGAWLLTAPSTVERIALLHRAIKNDGANEPLSPETVQRWADRILATDTPPIRTERDPLHLPNIGPLRRIPGQSRNPWHLALTLGTGLALGIAGLFGIRALQHTDDTTGATVYTTATGQHATITLRDGSQVTLAPKSELRIASGFGERSRTMTLRGEAAFHVVDASRTPFVVRTGTIATRVLGTTFNIRQYPENQHVIIAVVEGKVSAGSSRGPSASTVVAGQVIAITDSSVTSLSSSAASEMQWMDGRLVFNDAPAFEVLAALTRWYGYHFRLTDTALANKNLTVGLSTQSSEAALATLKSVLDVDLTFNGNDVTVSPKQHREDTARPRRSYDIFAPKHREVGQ